MRVMTVAAERQLNQIQIDDYSSEPTKPFGIITADKNGTMQFDDGIAVRPLPSNEEMYRVNVFVVDTSHLYLDDAIVAQAIARKETLITFDENDTYSRIPLIDDEITRDLHFSAKHGPLGALVVSFIVGKWCPPKDIEISYGHVEVAQNLPFEAFGGMCRDREAFKPYARAAAQIIKHLDAPQLDDTAILRDLLRVDRQKPDLRGLAINRAFMVAANYLAGQILRDESRPAVFRTHFYQSKEERAMFKDPLARFSAFPGPHTQLDYDVYAPITSPLRQAAPFLNHGQLFQRELGNKPTPRDWRLVKEGVASLNSDIRDRSAIILAS